MAVVVVTPNDRRGLVGLFSSVDVIIDWGGYLAHRWAMDNMDVVADLLIKTMRRNSPG